MIQVTEQGGVASLVTPSVKPLTQETSLEPQEPLPYAVRKNAYKSGWFDATCFAILVLLLFYGLFF